MSALSLAACDGGNTDSGGRKDDSAAQQQAAVATIQTIDLDGLKQMIQERNGKTLVLNMWATWCVPCKEEFPDLVRLARENMESLDVVGVSLDYPKEIDSLVIPFLKQNPVNFPVYVADVASQDEFINSLNPDWSGALPTTFIYSPEGKQTSMMVGKRTLTEFESAVSR